MIYKDGKPIKIISGAVHYFRNMPDTWSDIFKKMRAMGCNCVETYCVWNMHEKVPGEYDFSGMLNIAEFALKCMNKVIKAAIKNDLYIIIDWHTYYPQKKEAKAFFSMMAQKYGKYPHIIYEIYNEPMEDSVGCLQE